MKKEFLISMTLVALMAIGSIVYNNKTKRAPLSQLAMENIDALSNSEETGGGLDCSYKLVQQPPCRMTVKAEVAAKFMKIIGVNGDGTVVVEFSGAQECESGGNSTCEPARCFDIYRMIVGLL